MVHAVGAALLFATGTFIFPASFILQRYLWNATKFGKNLARRYSFTDKDVADISNKYVGVFQYFNSEYLLLWLVVLYVMI